MIISSIDSQVISLFDYTPLQYMLRAMAAGTAPATCYADREGAPAVCLVHEGHSLFVGGDVQSKAADAAMEHLAHGILTKDARHALGVMKIVFPNEAWKAKLTSALSDTTVHEYPRSVYKHPAPQSIPDASISHIQAITSTMASLENFDMIREEVESTLGSVDAFLQKAFGYALTVNGRVCGFCTAEYLSPGECAIGIAVEEPFRQKGYAAHMTACFLNECARRELTPYWECWKNNTPSYKTAERAGFQKITDYPVLLAEF